MSYPRVGAAAYVRYIRRFAATELAKDPQSPLWIFVDFMQDAEIKKITGRAQSARGAVMRIVDFHRKWEKERRSI